MSRHYVFTSYQDECPEMNENVRYLVYQREICPDSNREHWQGYAEFHKPMRVLGAQKELGIPKAHMEKRHGSRDEARDYCMKEESRLWGPYEHGEWKAGGQGKRNDIADVAEMVKEGATDREIAELYPAVYMKMNRGVKELRSALSVPRNWMPNVEVYWGVTGTGKSKLAMEMYPNAFVMSDEKGWWDGYDGQEDVVLNDFRPDWWGASFMLNLLDRYPMRVPIKGSSANFVGRNIIITTNKNPKDWYPEYAPHILRRCEIILEMTGDDYLS